MARFLIKHDMVPPSWARISLKGDKVHFGARQKASEFSSAEEAMAAFEKASDIMAAAAKEKERLAVLSGKKVSGYGCELIEELAPTWLRKKMGWKTDYYAMATGVFCAEATGLNEDAGAPFELFYARSEWGWLGGPRLKSRFGGADWLPDMSQAQAFLSKQALEAAISNAPSAQKISRFTANAVFTTAELANDPDDISQGIGAAVEARELQTQLEPSPQPGQKIKTGSASRI